MPSGHFGMSFDFFRTVKSEDLDSKSVADVFRVQYSRSRTSFSIGEGEEICKKIENLLGIILSGRGEKLVIYLWENYAKKEFRNFEN
jgi:hypothetical protein